MSRRFGKNQRRRMREQIAKTEQDLKSSESLVTYLYDTKNRLESELNWARNHLAHYTFALHPKNVRLAISSTKSRGTIRVERRPDYFNRTSEGDLVEELEAVAEDLPVMIARAKLDKMNGDLHVKVVYSDGVWGYALSEAAFLHQSTELLARAISIELTEKIIHDIRSK